MFIQNINYKNICSKWIPTVLTKEESELVWQPVIEFEQLMEFKQRSMYGDTDSSVSYVFPLNKWNIGNRLAWGKFQLTFSCKFDFTEFPFDSHECPLEYGDGVLTQDFMRFNTTVASFGAFGNLSTKSGGNPIILNNLTFPFEFQLVSLPAFELVNRKKAVFSYTGIVLKIRRISPGQLLIGYFYPTASFALLSMISFLIEPDMVRSLC